MEASPQQRNFVEVCSVEEIWEGEMQCFSVRDAAIPFLKLDGASFCSLIKGDAPIRGSPLSRAIWTVRF